jgi:hypothetical protein
VVWCKLPETHPSCLSHKEAIWRVVCRAGLRPVNRATMVEVCLVLSKQEVAQMEWDMGTSDGEQGNGNRLPV